MKNVNALCLVVLAGILSCSMLSGSVLADTGYAVDTSSGALISGTDYLKTSMVSQDPISAEPGGYVKLLFQVENVGASDAKNVTLQILPAYPFSLDPGVSAAQQLGTVKPSSLNDNAAFLVRFRLKVDENAVDDDGSEIQVKTSKDGGTSYYIDKFNVSVLDPKTDFDVVLQESTSTSSTTTTGTSTASTMLAIANIGANPASAVIAKIPEQNDFKITGTSANIIGDLNAGDYTLVTFRVVSKSNTTVSNGVKNLTVEISYTDTLGIRRTVDKYVALGLTTARSGYATGVSTQSQTLMSSGVMYIVIGTVGIVVIVVLIKFRARKKK